MCVCVCVCVCVCTYIYMYVHCTYIHRYTEYNQICYHHDQMKAKRFVQLIG